MALTDWFLVGQGYFSTVVVWLPEAKTASKSPVALL